MNLMARYWMAVPLLVTLTGCAEQLAQMHLDDDGKPCPPEQEFAWFLVHAFRMAFDNPLLLLGSIVGVVLLIGFGTALWAMGGVWRILGITMVVVGAAAYAYFLSMVYLAMALVLGVILSGFRRG
jgi:hypothetical protein